MIPLTTDLSGLWTTLWGSITGAVPNLTTFISIVGIAVIVIDLIVFFKDKRNGSGGDTKKLAWGMVFGLLLISPGVLIPVALKVVSWGFDLLVGVANSLIH